MAKTSLHRGKGRKPTYTTVTQYPDGSGRSTKRDGNKLWGNKVLSKKAWGKNGKPK